MAQYKLQGPDGQIHVVEGPDNATADQLRAAAKAIAAQRPAATPTPSDGGWLDTLKAAGHGVMSAIGSNLGTVAQMNPMNLIQSGSDALKSALGLDTVQNKVASAITGKPTVSARPQPTPNMVKQAIQKGVSSVGPAAPTTTGGKLISAATEGIANSLVGGPENIGEGVTNAISGALSGVSAEGANTLLPQDTPDWLRSLVTTGAGLIGGVAPTAGVSAANKLKEAVQEHSLVSGEEGAKNVAARQLQAQATDPAAAAAAIQARPPATAGTAPTTAEQAGDYGLAALQRSLPNNQLIAQQAGNVRTRAAAASAVLGGGDTSALTDLATQQGQDLATTLATRQARQGATREQIVAQNQEAVDALKAQHRLQTDQAGIAGAQAEQATQAAGAQKVADLHDTLGGGQEQGNGIITPSANSASIRQPFTDAYQKYKDFVGVMYDNIANQAMKVTGRRQTNMNAAIDATKSEFYNPKLGLSIDPQVQSLLDNFNATIKSGQLDSNTVMGLDKALSDIAGTKSAMNQTAEATAINNIRDTIRQHMDPIIPAAIRKDTDIARTARQQQYELYEQPQVGGLINAKTFGLADVPDTELAGRLAVPGNLGGTVGEQLNKAVNPDVAEQFVRGEMRRAADNGQFTSQQGMNAYTPLLDKFPNVKSDVQAIVDQHTQNATDLQATRDANATAKTNLARAQQDARTQVGRTGRTAVKENKALYDPYVKEAQGLNDTFAKSPMGALAAPLVQPHAVVGSMLREGNPAVLDMLHDQIGGNQDAINGVRRSIGDYIESQANSGEAKAPDGSLLPSGVATSNAIGHVLTTAKKFLTPEQETSLTNIKNELDRASFARQGGVLEGETPEAIDLPGKAGKLIGTLVSKTSNQKQVTGIIQKAMQDPQMAADLLKRATPDRLGRWTRTLRQTGAAALLGSQQTGQ